MRPIKFRAWDNHNKSMWWNVQNTYDSQYCHDKEFPEYPWDRGQDFFPSSFGEVLDKEGWNLEVMQFTGLKDRNGKEIYEGDIVRDYEEIQMVAWDNRKAGFVLLGGRDNALDHANELEVIGNIWEDPKLLKIDE